MAPVAQGDPIAEIPPEFGVRFERFDVVRVDLDARNPAMLTSCPVAADDVRRPLVLSGRAVGVPALPIGVVLPCVVAPKDATFMATELLLAESGDRLVRLYRKSRMTVMADFRPFPALPERGIFPSPVYFSPFTPARIRTEAVCDRPARCYALFFVAPFTPDNDHVRNSTVVALKIKA
jgi:hypothetical protein